MACDELTATAEAFWYERYGGPIRKDNSVPEAMASFATERTAALTAEVQRLEAALREYANEAYWFKPQFCNDYLHGQPGHECPTNKWGYNYKGDGYEIARAALGER